jgi:long-chain fatty acid transport protein
MNKLLTSAAVLALTTSAGIAGGIERGGNAYSTLFEKGDYIQLGYSMARPSVSGDYPTGLGGGSTDNMAKSYNHLSFAYKNQLTDDFAIGLYVNQPFGADAEYTGGQYQGLAADWKSNQLAVVGKYNFNENFSVYGGLRYIESSAEIAIPDAVLRAAAAQSLEDEDIRARVAAGEADLAAARNAEANLQSGVGWLIAGTIAALGLPAGTPTALALAGVQAGIADGEAALAPGQAAIALIDNSAAGTFDYTAEGEKDGQIAYVLGAAYEIPDIALRVALTYESGYTHKFDTKEFSTGLGIAAGTKGTTEVDMPQSVTLDVQSGIAKDTLLFGSIKWAEWSEWEVRTPAYEGATGQAVTGLGNDVFTFRLGVGRKFSDNFSGFARVTYEEAQGGEASRLTPTDGSTAFGIGGTYTMDNIKITGGIEYVKVGDAEDGSAVKFGSNDAIGLGITVGYTF